MFAMKIFLKRILIMKNTSNIYDLNIVVSTHKKDVTWLNNFSKNYKIFLYTKEDEKNKYNIPINRGNEASAYLKYILDFYEYFPDLIFFIHDDEFSWHHSGSLILKLEEALDKNLDYYNINDNCIMGNITPHPWYDEIIEWYQKYIQEFIPIEKLPSPEWTAGYRGSAQFLVNKKNILNLPKNFYENLYNWIIDTDMEGSKSGRFLEYTWHLFWEIYPKYIKN